MHKKALPVGVDLFEHLIRENYYYVDKTNLIRELLDTKGIVTLFTRPRRFGKTLNMSMLQYYFEDMRARDGSRVDNCDLFEGLNIMQAGERYTSQMGQYPVIFLSLKEGKQNTFESALRQMSYGIQEEYRRHAYLMYSDHLEDDAKQRYNAFAYGKTQIDDYKDSLRFLSGCLEQYYNKKAIILIDEYDVPLENAFVRGFYDEMVDFMRAFLGVALKTNASLHFAVLTGCLRISKESIFTGLNNLKIISILNDEYSEYFGFTEPEVMQMCEYYGFPEKYELVREWYDGYVFGGVNVYNPWSVIQYMSDLRSNSNRYPEAYWANTSSNSVVRELIDRADESVKGEIETLIAGGTITKPLHEDITYGEIYDNKDTLWNFMFFTGYFRKKEEYIGENDTKYLTFAIPNREVRYIFYNKVQAWFNDQIKQRDMSCLHNAFVEKDAVTVEEELNDIMVETISFMDEQESYYHGLVAGLLTGIKGYITKSNRESGKGRSDLVVKPVSRRREAFIIEFKVAKRLAELGAKTDEALKQIVDREYDRELLDDNYNLISHYGIAFCGKECAVKVENGFTHGLF